jgi:hypothetical protein
MPTHLAKRAWAAPSSADVCAGLAVQPDGRSDGTSSSLASAAFSAAEPVPAAVLVLALDAGLVPLLDVEFGTLLAVLVPGAVALLGLPLLLDEQDASRATAVSVPSAAAADRVPREMRIRRL